MDNDIVEGWVRAFIAARSPDREGTGGSGHAARTWSQLDEVESVAAEGERIRARFVWSDHRESEFTVYSEAGDESLLRRRTSELLFGSDGTVLEETHLDPDGRSADDRELEPE